MTQDIKLLDCTLRDGAHLNKGKFGKKVIVDTIKDLVEANVDIIEVGFFDNEEHLPIDGNVVNWYSDDNKKGEASLLQMYKQEDSIKIVFKKEKNDNYRIKIKNCDSKYAPANEAFMEMYNVLAYQNPRVKMEECINKKPRVLKR